jgi:hypothetical protein
MSLGRLAAQEQIILVPPINANTATIPMMPPDRSLSPTRLIRHQEELGLILSAALSLSIISLIAQIPKMSAKINVRMPTAFKVILLPRAIYWALQNLRAQSLSGTFYGHATIAVRLMGFFCTISYRYVTSLRIITSRAVDSWGTPCSRKAASLLVTYSLGQYDSFARPHISQIFQKEGHEAF